MHKRLLLVCLLMATPVVAEPKEGGVKLEWGVKIPMRDGVELNATMFHPGDAEAKLPVVFTLTPYTSDTYQDRAWYFARHGYVFALVDVRGRGNSGGEFTPFEQEAEDGHDVVEWLTLTSGVTANFNLFGQSALWTQIFRQLYEEHRPFIDLPEIAGNLSTTFETWMEHPHPDAYWDSMNPSAEDFERFAIPILTITGHYDGDQPGAMEFYKRHMEHGSEAAKASHFLILGPRDHAGTRTPRQDVGGLSFGEASLVDLNELHRDWYDWTMKEGGKPEFLENRVAYYLTGAEEWKYADSLEAIGAEP